MKQKILLKNICMFVGKKEEYLSYSQNDLKAPGE